MQGHSTVLHSKGKARQGIAVRDVAEAKHGTVARRQSIAKAEQDGDLYS